MHEPWFYCAELRVGRSTLDPGESRHALQVLRLRPGAAVILFDGRGQVARAVIVDSEPAGGKRLRTTQRSRHAASRGAGLGPICVLDVTQVECVPPPAASLTLIVAGCKGDRLAWLIETGTELGVARFVLADFEHSVVRVGPQHVERLQPTAVAACKQCRRPWLPQILAGADLPGSIANMQRAKLLVAHLAADAQPLGAWLSAHQRLDGDLAVVIGPEGGLSHAELELLRTAGGESVRLAPYVLRIETAAVAVAAAWAAHQSAT